MKVNTWKKAGGSVEIKGSDYRVERKHEDLFKKLDSCEVTDYSDQEIKEEQIPPLVEKLQELQLKLHAEEKNGILIVLQGMDASGKDEIITFVFNHFLPQGLKITPSKKPSEVEKKHDFLWRTYKGLPKRGEIAVFNRSYYEDVLALLVKNGEGAVPVDDSRLEKELWEERCEQINLFEKYLYQNGFSVLKIFPYVSKDVQKERLLERMKNPKKNWEFSFSDIEDRKKWDLFHDSYQKIMKKTSTAWAPWYVLPADNPWLTRLAAGQITLELLEEIKPEYPIISGEDKEKLDKEIKKLEEE